MRQSLIRATNRVTNQDKRGGVWLATKSIKHNSRSEISPNNKFNKKIKNCAESGESAKTGAKHKEGDFMKNFVNRKFSKKLRNVTVTVGEEVVINMSELKRE